MRNYYQWHQAPRLVWCVSVFVRMASFSNAVHAARIGVTTVLEERPRKTVSSSRFLEEIDSHNGSAGFAYLQRHGPNVFKNLVLGSDRINWVQHQLIRPQSESREVAVSGHIRGHPSPGLPQSCHHLCILRYHHLSNQPSKHPSHNQSLQLSLRPSRQQLIMVEHRWLPEGARQNQSRC